MFAYVTGTAKFEAGSSTTIAADAVVTTAGNLVNVIVRGSQVSSVTDTAGNTYVRLRRVSFGTTFELWECTTALGHATNVITANLSGNVPFRGIAVVEHSASAAFRRLVILGNSITTPMAGAAVSVGFLDDLENALVVMGASQDAAGVNWVAGSGFTERVEDSDNVQMIESQIVTTATDVECEMSSGAVNTKHLAAVVYVETGGAGGGPRSYGYTG